MSAPHATNEEWTAPSVSRWAREAQAFTWQPVGEAIDDLINFGQVSFVIREFGPEGQPTLFNTAQSAWDCLERDPGRPDGPLDRAARQYWRWGRAGCHPGAIQAGVENVDSVAVKNRLKKSASIAPV